MLVAAKAVRQAEAIEQALAPVREKYETMIKVKTADLPVSYTHLVVERIANMDRAVPSIIKIVENVVQKKIGSSTSEETTEVGGLNYVADVMNHVDRSTERDIFEHEH